MTQEKMITFDSRIWAPDRDSIFICEEEEVLLPSKPFSNNSLPVPSLERPKKRSLLRLVFPLSMAVAGIWCVSRFSREEYFGKKEKWGNAVSAVTGGHPEDINGM